jgi:molybdopterin molybdotransferase
MLTPQQAEDIIAHCAPTLTKELVKLEHALGRMTDEDLIADTDLPPFDRVMMDGIALRFSALESGIREFRIEGLQRAGQAPIELKHDAGCIEIMTGEICSLGCDTIIPYEHLDIANGIAFVHLLPDKACKNIHTKGTDKRKGDVLVPAHSSIGVPEIGIAASIGKQHIAVKSLPKTLICSTGDELVAIHETPLAHQIRRSNVYALQALLQHAGIAADTLHLPDDESNLKQTLNSKLMEYDILLFSGGVSKGKFDLLPQVLHELGVEMLFHGIFQRPGKPMWFGKSSTAVVFALPGNPVSTLACAARYVMPWLKKQLGKEQEPLRVPIETAVTPHDKLHLFVPVEIRILGGRVVARRIHNQGSGDFSALQGASGFIEIAPGTVLADSYAYYPLH